MKVEKAGIDENEDQEMRDAAEEIKEQSRKFVYTATTVRLMEQIS